MARYRAGLRTRARILEATRDVLAAVGLENTTLKAITDRADVGSGSFYNLFNSKEAAVFEVLREAIAAVDPDPAGLGEETLDDLIDAFVAFVRGPSAPVARIHLQLSGTALADDDVADRLRRSHLRRVERFAAALRRQQPDVDEPTAVAHAEILLGALMGLALRSIMDPTFDFEGHVARLPREVTATVTV